MRGTRPSSRSSSRGSTTTATSTRTSTPASTASAARRSRPRPSSSTASAPTTAPSPSGSRRRTGSSGSPPTRTRLLQLYDERPDFVLPGFRANEARSFIAGGLRDFSISRATQTWGIPIPWDPDQVAYVWADALINYLSALSLRAGGRSRASGRRSHLLAKDILRFHCVYWPALLLSAGYEPPRQLFVHGYLNLDNQKISKSLGNVLDPLDLVDEYGVDPVRFWVARVVPFGQDGDVTLDSFRERYERELANDLGNLLSRTTAMIARYRDGDLAPAPDESSELAAAARALHDDIPAALDRWDVTGALETIWDYVRRLNRHVEQTKPWELAKDPESRRRARSCALRARGRPSDRGGRAVGRTCPRRRSGSSRRCGQPHDVAWENVAYGRTEATSGIEPAQPLFPRIDEPATAA